MLLESGFQLDRIELYCRQRPLSEFTSSVSAENVGKINEILQALERKQRKARQVTERDGALYINHWYVMILVK